MEIVNTNNDRGEERRGKREEKRRRRNGFVVKSQGAIKLEENQFWDRFIVEEGRERFYFSCE